VLRIEYSAGFNLFSGQWFATYGQAIINFFSSYHPFVFAIIAGLYFWWRGISLGRSHLYFNDIYFAFLIQLITLVLLIILWGSSFKNEPLKNITSDIGIYIAGFFFFGLLALALSNLKIIQEKIRKKGESSKNFGRRWLTIILSVVGSIIVLGIGFASIFSAQFISSLGRFMDFISGAFSTLVDFLMLVIGFLVEWIYYVVEFLINLVKRGKLPDPPEKIDLGKPDDKQNIVHKSLSPQVILIIKLVVLTLIVFGVIYLISKAIRRRRANQTDDDLDEEHESLWSWAGFKADLMVFFKALFGWFKRKTRPAPADVSLQWQAEEDIKRRLSIREIYQHLLWQGGRLKIPREEHETPSEYAERLGRYAPDGKEPLNEITDLYINVRYGEFQTEEKKTDEANSIWEKLLNILRGPESHT
jgi:heme/copper-type cytochrome/quinol oxidase subunit 2